MNCDPMDEGDFPAVPKTDRRSGTYGYDFLKSTTWRSHSWRMEKVVLWFWIWVLCIWEECVVNFISHSSMSSSIDFGKNKLSVFFG